MRFSLSLSILMLFSPNFIGGATETKTTNAETSTKTSIPYQCTILPNFNSWLSTAVESDLLQFSKFKKNAALTLTPMMDLFSAAYYDRASDEKGSVAASSYFSSKINSIMAKDENFITSLSSFVSKIGLNTEYMLASSSTSIPMTTKISFPSKASLSSETSSSSDSGNKLPYPVKLVYPTLVLGLTVLAPVLITMFL